MSPTEKGIFLSLLPQVRQAGGRLTADQRSRSFQWGERLVRSGGGVGWGGTDSDVTRKWTRMYDPPDLWFPLNPPTALAPTCIVKCVKKDAATCMHGCCFKSRMPLQQRGQQWRVLESLERSAVFCQRAVQHIENKMSNLPVFCRPLLPWKQVQRLPISSFFFSTLSISHSPLPPPPPNTTSTLDMLLLLLPAFLPHDLLHSTFSHRRTHIDTLCTLFPFYTAVISQRHGTERHDRGQEIELKPWPCFDSGATAITAAPFWTPGGKKRGPFGEGWGDKEKLLKSTNSGSKNKAGSALFHFCFVWAESIKVS